MHRLGAHTLVLPEPAREDKATPMELLRISHGYPTGTQRTTSQSPRSYLAGGSHVVRTPVALMCLRVALPEALRHLPWRSSARCSTSRVTYHASRITFHYWFEARCWLLDVQSSWFSSAACISCPPANGCRIQTALPPGSAAPAGKVVQPAGANERLAVQTPALGHPHRFRPRLPARPPSRDNNGRKPARISPAKPSC
jgi:hypothetical protein